MWVECNKDESSNEGNKPLHSRFHVKKQSFYGSNMRFENFEFWNGVVCDVNRSCIGVRARTRSYKVRSTDVP